MIILKLITIIFLTLFIWMVFKLFMGVFKVLSFLRYGTQTQANKYHQKQQNSQQTRMVKCSTCDLYIVDTEALSRNGVYFCSPEHVQK